MNRHVDVCEDPECCVCASKRAERAERARAWARYRVAAKRRGKWRVDEARQARLTEVTG